MLFYVLNILAVFVCIAVHEYGHYIVARRHGVIAEQFVVGLGPTLYEWEYRGTRFYLGLIPVAGLVSFKPGALKLLTNRKHIEVLLAGPVANLVLSLVVVVLYVAFGGKAPSLFAELSQFMFFCYAFVGTIATFFVAVPLTIYAIMDTFIHPIAELNQVSGPIGVFSGTSVPESFHTQFNSFEQFMLLTWMLSVGIGSFNLIPLSILDGGQIFGILTARWPRFQTAWFTSTTLLLFALILYVTFGDVWKLFT